jgi:transposase
MHSANDFKQLAQAEKDGRTRIRYLALYHFQMNKSRYAIAELLGVSRTSVNKWVSDYLNDGIGALTSKKSPGRPASLSPYDKQQLARYVECHATKDNGGRLIAEDIRQYIIKQFKVDYKLGNIYRLLQEMGFSWITSRSKHPKQSQASQDVFKKVCTGNDLSHPISRST